MKTICCFCETIYSDENRMFCFVCDEYKGLMPLDDFDLLYGN